MNKLILSARRGLVIMIISCMFLPQSLSAAGVSAAVDEKPNPFAMVGDLVVARPLGLVMTAAGTATWLVTLPFTLLAGHTAEAADVLMLGPAKTTFWRCLGCRNTGYTGKDIEQKKTAP